MNTKSFRKILTGLTALGLVFVNLWPLNENVVFSEVLLEKQYAKKKGKQSTLIVITRDTRKKTINAPVYVNGKLKKKKKGKVVLKLKPKKYKVKFGDLQGYTLKSPKKGVKKVKLKKGKKKKITGIYLRNILQGEKTSLQEDAPFDFGYNEDKINASYNFIDSESVRFQGSEDSEVARSGLTDVSTITNAAQYTYTSGTTESVKEGEIVLYHNTVTDSYGAVKIDAIHNSSGSISSVLKAVSGSSIDITWYFITTEKTDFSDDVSADDNDGSSNGETTCSDSSSANCSKCSFQACGDHTGSAWYKTSDGKKFLCDGSGNSLNCGQAAMDVLSYCGCS